MIFPRTLKKRGANVVDEGTKITGNIHAENSFAFSGTLAGDLIALGDVRIETTAEIIGNVSGENVWIAGKIKGNVRATKHLHIRAEGSVDGEISYQTIEIEDGAVISGDLKQDNCSEFVELELPADSVKGTGKEEPAALVQETGKEETAGKSNKRQFIAQTPKEEPAFVIKNKRIMIQ
jgi:cytoskeletal protein CcmA (bactofilin family)